MTKKVYISNDFLNQLMPFFNLDEIKLDLDNLFLSKGNRKADSSISGVQIVKGRRVLII
jgi:hypothetical protein